VWASWCPPCREEFPAIMQVRRTLVGPNLALILVSTDNPSNPYPVRHYLAGQGALFPSFIIDNPDQVFISALSTNWSGGLPASFFFGKDGTLQQWWEGPAPYEKFAQAATALVQTNASRL